MLLNSRYVGLKRPPTNHDRDRRRLATQQRQLRRAIIAALKTSRFSMVIPRHFTLLAGPLAATQIRENGFATEQIQILVGASGGLNS